MTILNFWTTCLWVLGTVFEFRFLLSFSLKFLQEAKPFWKNKNIKLTYFAVLFLKKEIPLSFRFCNVQRSVGVRRLGTYLEHHRRDGQPGTQPSLIHSDRNPFCHHLLPADQPLSPVRPQRRGDGQLERGRRDVHAEDDRTQSCTRNADIRRVVVLRSR